MLGHLLRYVINNTNMGDIDRWIIITDNIPVAKKKKAIEKAIKQTLAKMLPDNCNYSVFHHSSRAHFGLQIADYCNWAIFRKWERGDEQYWGDITTVINSEFDIFRSETNSYY